jgi:NADH-quinone oxidoreductase subunit L
VSPTTFEWIVLALPLAGSVVIALGWRLWPGRLAGWIGTGAIFLAFLAALGATLALLDRAVDDRELTSSLYDYAAAGGLEIQLGILVDPLAVYMTLVVTGVSTLIHLYSVAYLWSDRGYSRYFSYLNFFVFSMLLLILAGNFVLLIVGWAFVGFASYALISFYYRRHTATTAGMKAFVINVIGDVALVFAAFFIFRELGTFDYLEAFGAAGDTFSTNEGSLIVICLLIMVGAFAKSAQIPFHTWLPDAMEGPTPVSALIHAATMVTAGVYLIARVHPFFEIAPTAAYIAGFIGTATLLFAATVALVVTDIKRAIAYSTISQIGYMIMGVSIGAYAQGLFHLMSHAFFKALLFMSAGSVISAMGGIQNMDKMGGFRRALPFTFVLMTIGALALAAFPFTSGFFSKDSILGFAAERGGAFWIMSIGGYVGAFITAIYAFRIIFRVFGGKPCKEARELERGKQHHAEPVNPQTGEPEDVEVGFPGKIHSIAERAWPMAVAMAGLGIGALFAGYIQVPGVDDLVTKFLTATFEGSPLFAIEESTTNAWIGLGVGAAVSILGVAVAYWLWIAKPGITARMIEHARHLHRFLLNKWYFDEAQDAVVYRPVLAVGRFFNAVVERYVVEGLASGTIVAARGLELVVRTAQSGFVRSYALLMIAGFVGLGLYFLIFST